MFSNGYSAGSHHELPVDHDDPVLRRLHVIMRMVAYMLAIAMVFVILVGVVSVLHAIYVNLALPPLFLIPDIIRTFGAFLAVLIAYEIFANITLYIRTDVFPMKLVIATAIMAAARKVIVFDFSTHSALDLIGIGVVIVALGVAYWLVSLADARKVSADQGGATELAQALDNTKLQD